MVQVVNLILIRLFMKNTISRYKEGIGEDKPYSTYTQTDWQVYLTGKLDLFLTHCLPSVAAQTDQNFDCLVLVDKTFPEYSFIQKELEANQHLFQLEYVDFPWGDGYKDTEWEKFVFPLQKRINEYVRKRYPKNRKFTHNELKTKLRKDNVRRKTRLTLSLLTIGYSPKTQTRKQQTDIRSLLL